MKYEFSGRVRYSEIDEEGKLSLPGLINYFQDVSTFQSEDLGVGMDYLRGQSAAWILLFWQIVINRLPRLGDEILTQTFAYGFKSFLGMRNFALMDRDREIMARANSVWAFYNLEKGRPVNPEPQMLARYGLEEKLEMEYAPRKIAMPAGGELEPAVFIGQPQLDTNHHVNNGQYVAMAAAYLPADFAVRQVKAEYRMQAHLHDEIIPRVCRLDENIFVALENTQGKPYAVVEFEGA